MSRVTRLVVGDLPITYEDVPSWSVSVSLDPMRSYIDIETKDGQCLRLRGVIVERTFTDTGETLLRVTPYPLYWHGRKPVWEDLDAETIDSTSRPVPLA